MLDIVLPCGYKKNPIQATQRRTRVMVRYRSKKFYEKRIPKSPHALELSTKAPLNTARSTNAAGCQDQLVV